MRIFQRFSSSYKLQNIFTLATQEYFWKEKQRVSWFMAEADKQAVSTEQ